MRAEIALISSPQFGLGGPLRRPLLESGGARNDLFVAEPVEFIDAGGDGIVVVLAMSVLGRDSDVRLDSRAALVYEVRNGKIARDRWFTSRASALEAVGLSQ